MSSITAVYLVLVDSSTMHHCTVQCGNYNQLETSMQQSSLRVLLKWTGHQKTTNIVKQYIIIIINHNYSGDEQYKIHYL